MEVKGDKAMANEIEMDTSLLGRDIDNLENTLTQLETWIEKMFDTINKMDTMWKGPANNVFNVQFKNDYETCKTMCGILRELIGSLNHAKEEYDKCEQNVNNMIRSIKI